MADLHELDQLPEEVPAIDWDAPEPGSFPPRIYPATYKFLFRLPESQEDQFEAVVIQKVPCLQVNYIADIAVSDIPEDQRVGDLSGVESVKLTFQRASTYKTEKMTNSMVGDLLRALNLKPEAGVPMNKTWIMETLRAADGRAYGWAEIGWRVYNKDLDTEISTHPNKKKGHLPWPRGNNKRVELMAQFPNGTKAYGSEFVARFKLPQA